IYFRNISTEKTINWVETELKEQIMHKHYQNSSFYKNHRNGTINVIYILINELVLDIENNGVVSLLFSEKSEQAALTIQKQIEKFRVRRNSIRKINLITERSYGLDLLPISNKKPKLDLNLNYNDDLLEVHNHLVKNLNKKNKSGLVLFHGIPGTGKSTYIRYLIHKVKKTVIFLPPRIAANLDSPGMTSLLVDNPNSIFIIEDAEELIKSREGNGGSSISMLLNLTDGMLGESIGVQVICTFNTHTNNIDKALLRKGRLIASYEFKELQSNKSKVLLEKLGNKNYITNGNMTLADIYNVKEKLNEYCVKHKKQIGFKQDILQ
ncbi:MAG: AAA family ATPase, partial [Ignavibacterium sp.]|nr:AAA family ATPase [Ignavibacterium sp.]